jgi:hypothetical protein
MPPYINTPDFTGHYNVMSPYDTRCIVPNHCTRLKIVYHRDNEAAERGKIRSGSFLLTLAETPGTGCVCLVLPVLFSKRLSLEVVQ